MLFMIRSRIAMKPHIAAAAEFFRLLGLADIEVFGFDVAHHFVKNRDGLGYRVGLKRKSNGGDACFHFGVIKMHLTHLLPCAFVDEVGIDFQLSAILFQLLACMGRRAVDIGLVSRFEIDNLNGAVFAFDEVNGPF